jgi:DNA mismatch repair protein MutS2
MENAKSLMEPRHVLFEDWLTELQDDRRRLQELTEETERTRAQAQLLRRELSAQMDYLVTHREEMLDGVRRQLVARYEEIDKKTRRLEAAASWQPAPGRLEQARTEIEEVKRELEVELEDMPVPTRSAPDATISGGDFVHVRGLNLKGQVLSVSDEDGEAEVNVGKVRLRIDLARLSRADDPEAEEPTPAISANLGPSLSSLELDIRGFRAEEALISVEQFLDKAVRDGLSSVRIIHGKGTGALREAVREHLEGHPLARSFESEPRERGGSGATAVELN